METTIRIKKATAALGGKVGCLVNRKVGSSDLAQSVVVPLGKELHQLLPHKDVSGFWVVVGQAGLALIGGQASVSPSRVAVATHVAHHYHHHHHR